ncbi:MAG: twin-arginine translocase subunit TatB [Burkholderiaceae bacterium]|nr:MAG: twin-arginine translocase subunit TatB [Burkholderiaceae bacterium]
MFDIGLSELGVIGVVALVVLGPERLPKVARAAGRWAGKLQRYVNDVKADIHREAELAELKALQNTVSTLQQSVNEELHSIHAPDDVYDAPAYPRARKKNLRLRRTTIPLWYKRQQGLRAYIQSGAARVKRHRKSAP